MELLVLCNTLVFYVVGDHCKIAVLTHSVDVVSVCPELLFPEEGLHFYI